MTKEDIQNMMRDEFNRNYNSGNPRIPPHTHNGVDNLKIPASNIVGLSAGSGISGRMIFSSSGTFTVPSSITKVKVTLTGGGQGGGRITGGAAVANPGVAADYVESIVNLTGVSSVSVTIGAGGAGRSSGSGGGAAGSDSSFGSLVVAKGGGSGTTSVGDFIVTGFIAQIPNLTLAATGASTNTSQLSQAGGGTLFGPGGQAALGTVGSQAGGNTGQGYGSGGSGGASGTGGGAASGGNGMQGIAIIEY